MYKVEYLQPSNSDCSDYRTQETIDADQYWVSDGLVHFTKAEEGASRGNTAAILSTVIQTAVFAVLVDRVVTIRRISAEDGDHRTSPLPAGFAALGGISPSEPLVPLP